MLRVSHPRYIAALAVATVVSVNFSQPVSAEFLQQGPKLAGAGASGFPYRGSVAISADGNTAIIGQPDDAGGTGAVWIFARNNGVWAPQGGGKLVGANAVGAAEQGTSVALSADGNTVLIGGAGDSGGVGAAWVLTRSNGIWSQGAKLVGTIPSGAAGQGISVALSSDGQTAIVGGSKDNAGRGAAWVYTRSGGTWTQQGLKLVGSDAIGAASQGYSVALSGDGNTAVIGGRQDNTNVGSAWVFKRNAGVWSQFGNKLVGSAAAAPAQQGRSVAISADGKTIALGGPMDSATWVFTFNGSTWAQQGSKLVATGGGGEQGTSVSLSGDGDTLLVGAPWVEFIGGEFARGAAWIFVRSNGVWSQLGNKLSAADAGCCSQQGLSVSLAADGSTAIVGAPSESGGASAGWVWLRRVPHDLSGDGKSDILWRNGETVAAWALQGGAVLSGGTVASVPTSWSIVGQRDFDGDRKADLLWRDISGNTVIWFMNGTTVVSAGSIGNVPSNWSIVGTGDFNGDGKGDLIWRDTAGNTALWLMNGATPTASASFNVPANFSVVAVADFNRTLKDDILWRDTAGNYTFWFVDGTTVISSAFLGNVGGTWFVAATGDFNNDSRADILWRDASGNTAIWILGVGGSVASSASLGVIAGGWTVAEAGDFNGDGRSDILWRNTTTGDTAIWYMDGVSLVGSAAVANVPPAWVVQSTNAN